MRDFEIDDVTLNIQRGEMTYMRQAVENEATTDPNADPAKTIADLITKAKGFLAEMGPMSKKQVYEIFPETGGRTYDAYIQLNNAIKAVEKLQIF